MLNATQSSDSLALTQFPSYYFISLTTDNASINDVLIRTAARCLLARYGIPWNPDMQIRCIAHIVNLIVQAILHGVDEADDPSLVDYFELHKDEPIHYDPAVSPEQKQMEEEPEYAIPDVDDDGGDAEEIQSVGNSPLKRVSVEI